MNIGIDAGVGNTKVVFLENGQIVDTIKLPTEGKPAAKIEEALRHLKGRHKLGITGAEGKIIQGILSEGYVNHAIAVSEAFNTRHPAARTVLDIGRESSCYYLFTRNGGLKLEDFSSNSLCGAGGGALMEKMASRLQFRDLEEFVERAYLSESTARIAGRCGVFAESDVVHHFQKAAPKESIAAGLCYMLARNLTVNLLQHKAVESPVYLIGGVSQNKAVLRSLQKLLEKDITVPEDWDSIKALGAALHASKNFPEIETSEFLDRLKEKRSNHGSKLRRLSLEKSVLHSVPYEVLEESKGEKVILSQNEGYTFPKELDCFLGFDVGSVSTKAAVIDSDGRFIFGIYRRTSGKPIDAVIDVARRVGEYLGSRTNAKVLGAGVTGSGREVAGQIIGADCIRNEITAQAKGASYFVPEVDTVFEIGGQDSKYISIVQGRVIDTEMNKACAASTGSFLEEQAKSLGIKIEQEFANLALSSENPCGLAEKCAILMSSSLAHYSSSPLGDKCAGLAYSVAGNYLNRVVGRKKIGDHVVFQGAVAFNNAIVAAFETILDKKIQIPQYPHLTGAVGMANLTRDKYHSGEIND